MNEIYCNRCEKRLDKKDFSILKLTVFNEGLTDLVGENMVKSERSLCRNCLNGFYEWFFKGLNKQNDPRFDYAGTPPDAPRGATAQQDR